MRRSVNIHQIFGSFLVMILFGVSLMAQDPQRSESPDSGEESAKDSPKDSRRQAKSEKPSSTVSFTDSLFLGMGNNATFSVGMFEGYNSNILSNVGVTSPGRVPDAITSVYTRFFARTDGRNAGLSVDYSTGYRLYADSSELNGPEHRGTVTFRAKPSRRSWFEFSEYIASLANDSHTLLSQPLAPNGVETDFSQQILMDRQRIFTNVAKAEIGYELSRRTQLSVYGSYVVQRFESSPLHDADGFLLGLHFRRQFNRWMSFETNYEVKLSEFNNQYGQANVHHLDVGGLTYRVQPTVTIFASGGVEYAEFQGTYRPGAGIRSGIAKQTRTTNLSLEYHRGFSSTLGLGTLTQGDAVAVRLNRRLTPWMNLIASSIYSRNLAFVGPDQTSGPLYIFQIQPGLQFAVRRNLIFSLSCDYFKQNTDNYGLTVPNSSRYYIAFGFEYVLGSRR